MPDTPSQTAYPRDDDQQQRLEAARRGPLPASRLDLQISPQLYLGKTVYVVKDPVSLTYFRLRPAEHMIFNLLDGRTNALQIAEQVNAAFPDQRTDPDDVLRFVTSMRSSGLLMGVGAAHAKLLRNIRDTKKKRIRRSTIANYMFLRLPLIDPDRLLAWMHSRLAPLMNRWTMWAALAFMMVSAVAAFVAMPRTGALAFPVLGATNLMLFTGAFVVVKVIHEFGHGLAAKHRGLEVHEMGVLMMIFLPMLYVDVSDAWMVPRRRDRLWITAGGVFIEFLFASVCVWVWLFTSPGVVNQTAFNVMLAASITTLVFNANPLLRYDGYYFLMDWLEIPNLRTKASRFLGYIARRYLLAMPDAYAPEEALRRPVFMVVFAVASWLYRWVVVFGIIVLIWHVLDPYGLESIGALMGFGALVTMILLPMFNVVKFVWQVQAKTWRRAAFSVVALTGLGMLAAAILSIPLEDVVEQPAVVLAEHRTPVHAPVSGRIDKVFVTLGQHVEKDQPILQLVNEQLTDKLDELLVEHRIDVLAIDHARSENRYDLVTRLAEQVRHTEDEIEYVRKRIAELTIRAPMAGRLQPEVRLESMIGVGVEAGQQIGVMIGEAGRRLVMVLPQDQAGLVQAGQPVRARLRAMPDVTFRGHVQRVAHGFMTKLPHEALSSFYGGEVDTRRRTDYKSVPGHDSFEVHVVLHDWLGSERDPASAPPSELLDGQTGRVKVVLGRASLGARQWRRIREAMSLDWWL